MFSRAVFRIVCSIFILSVGSACSVTDRVSYSDQEGPIPDDLIKQIKAKKTEKAWITAHLGEPFAIDRIETAGKNSEVLYEVYSYRLSKTSVRAGHVLYFFKAGGREDEIAYFHVAFDKNIVQKSWLDKYSRAQLGPRLREEKVKIIKVASQKDADHVMKLKKKSKVEWKIPILKKWFGAKKAEPEMDSGETEADDGMRGREQKDMGGSMPDAASAKPMNR